MLPVPVVAIAQRLCTGEALSPRPAALLEHFSHGDLPAARVLEAASYAQDPGAEKVAAGQLRQPAAVGGKLTVSRCSSPEKEHG